MAHRRGRKRRGFTDDDREKDNLSDEILNQLKYKNPDLSKSDFTLIRETLDDMLKNYNIERLEYFTEDFRSNKDTNIEITEKFLQAKRLEGRSEKTIYNYGQEISRLFQYINKDYRDIEADDIREFLERRRKEGNLSNTSLKNIRLYLMSFWKWLVINDYTDKNIMLKINPIKTESHIVNTITSEQEELIRMACTNERDLAMIDLLQSSGMRVSEMCGLNRADVNFDTCTVKVFGKGSKERLCYFSGRCKVHLQAYLSQREDDNPALFVAAKKPFNRIQKNSVEFILRQISEKTGIEGFRLYPHRFRSSLASRMFNNGSDIATIQHILGHQSSATTQIYIDIDPNRLKAEHDKYIS